MLRLKINVCNFSRDIYPKSEVERTLGKFQTVTNSIKTSFGTEKLPEKENRAMSDPEREASSSVELPTGDDESKNDKKAFVKDDKSYTARGEIKQESVNYLGYYSSHEQVMQQLILDCASATQKQINNMVAKGKKTRCFRYLVGGEIWFIL